MVHVPAGWLHQVENLQDCVKIGYQLTWQHVLVCVIKLNAPYYMADMGMLWATA